MNAISNLQLFTLISVIIFFIVLAIRTIKILRAPLNLRWEIMPIPHEKDKFSYGGSYYEEMDWWTKPLKRSKLTELTAMLEEIIFIKSLFKKNRQLWWFSYPFHTGLYLLTVSLFLIVIGAIAENNGTTIAAGSSTFGTVIHYLTIFCGFLGLVLAIIGAFGLLLKRMFRKELRLYSAPTDYFNLVLFLFVLVTGFASMLAGDGSFSIARSYVAGIFSFSPVYSTDTAMTLHLIFAGVLFIYLPFTHMIHFMAKYFAYHEIRWADDPNASGSKVEKKVKEQLGYKVSWLTFHVKKGGTWADAATDTE